MEDLVDLIATDASASDISDKIKERLYAKAAEYVDAARPVVGADLFGDEADTVISATYVDGDVTIAGKANTQDEMEVSVSFAF